MVPAHIAIFAHVMPLTQHQKFPWGKKEHLGGRMAIAKKNCHPNDIVTRALEKKSPTPFSPTPFPPKKVHSDKNS